MAMSNTDEMLVQEFNLIMDNAGKLIVGNKYTYAKLMEALGLPIKAKGSTRMKQVERLKQYLNWDSKTCIFDGINEDATPCLKGTYTSEYYELIKNCLSTELYDYIQEHKHQATFIMSYDRLLSMCGITSDTFKLAKHTFAEVKIGEKLELKSETVKIYRQQLKKDAKKICVNALNNMKKEGLIDFDEATFFMFYERDICGDIDKGRNKDGEYTEKISHIRRASDEEVSILETAKSKVLEQMFPNVEPNKRSYKLLITNKYKSYANDVTKFLKEKHNISIDAFFDGFELDLDSFKGKHDDAFLLTKYELKLKFQAKMINCKDKNYLKPIENEKGNFGDNASIISKLNEIMIVGNEEFHKELIDSLFKHNVTEHKNEILNDVNTDERAFNACEKDFNKKQDYRMFKVQQLDNALCDADNNVPIEDLDIGYFEVAF